VIARAQYVLLRRAKTLISRATTGRTVMLSLANWTCATLKCYILKVDQNTL
jgi:hypothetical protein